MFFHDVDEFVCNFAQTKYDRLNCNLIIDIYMIIIISNPRIVDDNLALNLYLKSKLPEKSYFKALAGCAVRGYINTVNKIFEDKVNLNNIDVAISEFEDFGKQGDNNSFNEDKHSGKYTKIIYRKLKELEKK